MVKTVKGWMQNWVHALIQRACYPKFTVKMKGWEFAVLGPPPLLVSHRHLDDRIHRRGSKGHSAVYGGKQLMLLVILRKRWVGERQTECKRWIVNHKPNVTHCYKKRQLQYWMHRLEFSIWHSPSALLGTGKASSEVPDLIWGPVLQERHGTLGESPEDAGECGRRSRDHPYKERFRTEIWRKRGYVIPNTVKIPRRPPRGG